MLILSILATILSIVGVILNIKKRKECFSIWVFSNICWIIYAYQLKLYLQILLFFVYLLLAIWGLIEWNKNIETRMEIR